MWLILFSTSMTYFSTTKLKMCGMNSVTYKYLLLECQLVNTVKHCFLHPDHYTVLMAACASSHDREDHILSCINALIDKGSVVNSFDRFTLLLYTS